MIRSLICLELVVLVALSSLGGVRDVDVELSRRDTDSVEVALPTDPDRKPAGPTTGDFRLLNYNVAGLPEVISGADPELAMPLISPLLNDFEIVLVQEDFWYHDLLSASAEHPYQSRPSNPVLEITEMGDGLNYFSVYPTTEMQRIPWPGCNGTFDCASDCLATKGFTFARHQIAPGVEIDIYNLHNEAGRCRGDYAVRRVSTDLMFAEIERRSAGRAIIVAGDFNLLVEDSGDEVLLERWQTNMADVCVALKCGLNRRERTYLRDGDQVRLTALEYVLDGDEFHYEDGGDLSDHPPQWSRIGWELVR